MAAKAHKPSAETRAQVEALSGYGVRHDEIALYLEIDPKTLRKHYRDQLDKGHIKANVGVARALHKNATEGNVTAQIFWMKTRCGWKETATYEHTGPGGKDLIPPPSQGVDWLGYPVAQSGTDAKPI